MKITSGHLPHVTSEKVLENWESWLSLHLVNGQVSGSHEERELVNVLEEVLSKADRNSVAVGLHLPPQLLYCLRELLLFQFSH